MIRIRFGSWIPLLPADHPDACNYRRNYRLDTVVSEILITADPTSVDTQQAHRCKEEEQHGLQRMAVVMVKKRIVIVK